MENKMDSIRLFANKLMAEGDRENANKDAHLNSTRQALISERTMKELYIEGLKKEWVEAHDNGYIHIHDLGSRFLNSHNCNLFDMAKVLKNGFELNGVRYKEPSGVQTAMNVASDIILSASAQQYGGFSVGDFDTVFAKYAERTYEKALAYFMEETGDEVMAERLAEKTTMREIEQGYQAVETKLNTISNALGQTPFVTISFGLDTSRWGREVSKAVLRTRLEGLGEMKTTAVFPKLVLLHRKEISDGVNADIKQLGVECSRKRLYPDWLSLDEGYLKEVYERSGKAITPMGCRAFLSPFMDGDEEIYQGRGNVGAVTLNLPLYALEAENEKAFYEMIDKYSEMVFAIHRMTYERVSASKGSTNPLFYCEGGAWRSVGYDEEIRPIVEAFTASLGFIGLEETVAALYGGTLEEHVEKGTAIVGYLKEKVDAARTRDKHLYALYATPGESLIERFQNINRGRHGVVEGVTDKAYMSNSFHQHVTRKHIAPRKMLLEKPMFDISTGGRIQYCEFPHSVDHRALRQNIDFAMKLGFYHGVNIEASTCQGCGHQGEFECCPRCGSTDVTSVNRCCGYLSYSKVKGKTRYNEGKRAEIRDRVDHGMEASS